MNNGEPRVGVYICHCGTNIAGVIDVEGVADFARKLEGVVLAKDVMYACSEPTQREIKEDIQEEKLNQVVVAACSPKMHEPTFQAVVEEAGLNKYLFEMANIREQDSWVHKKNGAQATEKAKDLVKMAVARALLLAPNQDGQIPIGDKVLVIGGGIAGIQASLDLADGGYQVYLVEKEPTIGGRMAQLDKTFPTLDCSTCILAPKMSEVARNPNIEVIANAEVTQIDGHVGDFTAHINQKARFVTSDCTSCNDCTEVCPVALPDEFNSNLSERKAIYKPFPQAVPSEYVIDFESCLNEENLIACEKCIQACDPKAISFDLPLTNNFRIDIDTIIVATGTDPYDPEELKEYGYGKYDDVISTLDFERIINASGPTNGELIRPSNRKPPKKVSFIQCIGSRNSTGLFEHPYCSGICCMVSIKQAFLIKEKWPETEVEIYYIDIRAAGKGFEELYQKVRKEGVHFIKGIPAEIREEDGKLRLTGENILMGEMYDNQTDLVILSVGLEARESSLDIQKRLNICAVNSDGFFIEKHPKLEPVDTANAGIFIAGTAESPKDIRESSTQGKAAASRASRLMKQEFIKIEALTAVVDEDLCSGCEVCVSVCPYDAIEMRDGRASVIDAACQGCGACASSCPTGAITMLHFTDDQILAQVDKALEVDPEKKMIVFACNWCSYEAADLAGSSRSEYPASSRIIRVMCSGRMDPQIILRAFQKGAGGVLLSGCHPGDCHYLDSNYRAWARHRLLRKYLKSMGIDERRFELGWFSAGEAKEMVEKLYQMDEVIQKLSKRDIRRTVNAVN